MIDPSASPHALPAWTLLVILPAFYFGAMFVVSLFDSWFRLGRRYRTDRPLPGQIWRGVSGSVGLGNYTAGLSVGVDPVGIWLAVPFVLRPFHPPLLVPWTALRIDPPKKWWFRTVLDILIVDDGVRVTVRGKGIVNALWEAARTCAPGSCAPDYVEVCGKKEVDP